MKRFKFLGLFTVLFVIMIIGGSWGYLVHKTTHQLAVYQLPKSMQRFYYRNIQYLVDSAPRPDMRRNYDTTEANKHFIDLEQFGDSSVAQLPHTWEEAVKKFTLDSLLEYGYVPYQVLASKENLIRAFRNRNSDSIVYYSADLGHYISDANVPLHSSVNYDGQLSGQKGLHSLWESLVPEVELSMYNLRSRHKATYLRDPAQAIMNAIEHSSSLLPDVFGKEKELSASFPPALKFRTQVRRGKEYQAYTPEFIKAYGAALNPTVNDQLIRSANLVADFWYTCWVDGGKPDLDNLLSHSYSKADKRSFKAERKSHRRNHLVSDSLLRSKWGPVRTD